MSIMGGAGHSVNVLARHHTIQILTLESTLHPLITPLISYTITFLYEVTFSVIVSEWNEVSVGTTLKVELFTDVSTSCTSHPQGRGLYLLIHILSSCTHHAQCTHTTRVLYARVWHPDYCSPHCSGCWLLSVILGV